MDLEKPDETGECKEAFVTIVGSENLFQVILINETHSYPQLLRNLKCATLLGLTA